MSMYIDVKELNNKTNFNRAIDVNIESEDFFVANSEVKVIGTINFSGRVKKLENIIYLDGQVTGKLSLLCSRCLERFQYLLNIEISEKFTQIPSEEDEYITFLDRDKINLIELLESNILMSLPIKKLCNEDCKGLCQQCGCDLNKKTCDCSTGIVDPRLAKLKELFFTD
ncbi:MAG: DUF177 domain-containing protein [Clostridia bacterium]|nr:DUF177 domain-containing protein [Clostridia bacterium]